MTGFANVDDKFVPLYRLIWVSAVPHFCGNDDCGQMSAWYLFSALGFYPVAPGSGQYSLGSPVVKTAVIKLENGRTLTIRADGQAEKNVYVKRVVLNGRQLNRNYLTFQEISNGGTMVFEMVNKPAE